ncbi:unnamed protein product [Absidia cylindrospora]
MLDLQARRKEKVRTLSLLVIIAFTTFAFIHIQYQQFIPETTTSTYDNSDSNALHHIDNSIKHPNPNLKAAFVTFTKSDTESLTKLRSTIRDLQDQFNNDRNYPYIVFSNEELSDEFKELTRPLSNNNIIFEHLNSTFYGYPDFIDMARANKARDDMKDIIFGASDDYRFQARFMAGMMFRHPAMADLDYYWRFEIGTHYLTPITFDPFEYMKRNGKKLSFSFALYEYHDTIPTLYPTVERYINDHPGQIFHKTELDTLWSFILDDGSETYNDCHFWSNFQIGDLNFFRGQKYQDFFNHIDRTGGIFYERWGDPVIHTMASLVYLKKSQIHHWDSIGYQVGQFMHCPEDENIWKSGVCRPISNFDYQDFSCLPLFLQ